MSLRYLSLIVAVVLLAACSPVTQENFAKLQAGMSRAEVEKLLGKPGELYLGAEKPFYQHPVRW